jgi:hypothetical protein
LKINDSVAFFDYGYYPDSFHYKLDSNKFTLIEYYWIHQGRLRHEKAFRYEITKLTADTLVIKPLSEISKRLIGEHNTLVLIDSSVVDYPNFKFEKLYFSSTTCLGSCPQMKIEIDSVGKVYFFGEYNTGKYIGQYEGQLKFKDLNSACKKTPNIQ